VERRTAVVFAIDELQYLPKEQLAALISALHRISQHQLPITMVAAGLPQLVGQTGKAKSYAERLFEFTPIDRLDEQAARDALCSRSHGDTAFTVPLFDGFMRRVMPEGLP
jgi:hypothetical protein